jgi:hypothetical protein
MAEKIMSTYQYGNTVRLECNFYDFSGLSVNPDFVKVVIYNSKYEVIFTETLSISNRSDVGKYFYDYITEKKEQKIYYEWYGEINGKPSIKRGQFITKFI